MIIDPKDFAKRTYKIPNQQESRDLVNFLQEAEEEIAIGILGKTLWEDFNEAVNTSGTDPIYQALFEGADYTYNNDTYHYDGWVDLVRPAIYSMWIPATTDKMTNIGFVTNNSPKEAKVLEDPETFVVTYWNEFVTKVGYNALCGYNRKGTFYGFMKANSANYPDWMFRCPKPKNRFGF